MSKLLVEAAFWERVEPLLPTPKPHRFRYPSRKPLDHRAALTGILFTLKTGLPWNDLLREMGCDSGAACWVRLHEWHRLGVWAWSCPGFEVLPHFVWIETDKPFF